MVLAVLIGSLATFLGGDHSIDPSPAAANSPALGVNVSIDKMDASANTAQVTWWVQPEGTLSADGVPSRDVVLSAPELSDAEVTFKASVQPTTHTATIEFPSGDTSLYPFDAYTSRLHFAAESAGSAVPVLVTVTTSDPGFTLSGRSDASSDAVTTSLTVQRTLSARGMAVLMFFIMWALALAVAAAAWVILRKGSGLVWPAMGWMAATLFALVAFRNAAPGSPPIGCLLDLTAFFWAELIVVASLVSVVGRGIVIETRAG